MRTRELMQLLNQTAVSDQPLHLDATGDCDGEVSPAEPRDAAAVPRCGHSGAWATVSAHSCGTPRDRARSTSPTPRGHDDGGALASQFAAGEEPRLSADRPGPHLVFAVVVIHGHVAVLQVCGQRGPVVQAVVDRPGNAAPVGHALALELQPDVHLSHSGFDRLCLTASRSVTVRLCTSRSMR